MTVRKHMSAHPITVSDDTDFKKALGLMQKHRIRRLPVVDQAGVLIGIVAERDLLVAADRYLSAPVDVARIMTRDVLTVGDTTPVVNAAMLMIERKIGGLPVVDESRRLLGIITETDLLKALAAILQRDQSRPRSRKARSAGAPAQAALPPKRTGNPRAAGKTKPAGAKSKGGRKPRPATPKKVKRAGSR